MEVFEGKEDGQKRIQKLSSSYHSGGVKKEGG